ncbi:MAG: electron transport complex subunit RsxC [Spirochaetales bacterium]|nr:electron transport complex subunit RsxC [Spirochaetales bacterium]
MNEITTFKKGGIHPPDSKIFTKNKEIRNANIPSIAYIPMHQHMGKPAECIVEKGDIIREEMLLGKATGFFSANIHSPIPGKVVDIKEIYLPSGMKSNAVIIELAGEFDRAGKSSSKKSWENLSPKELIDKISDMGIVGLGGATFPTHIKYTLKEGFRLEYFIINGVECEPYLTADHRLMLEKTEEILEGIQIVKKILGPENIIIGIEENKPDAIDTMQRLIADKKYDIEVVPLKTKYPQGDEKQLLQSIINREVPSGGLPLDIGSVVSNVGTIFAIYEAIVYEKPLIERIVTVSGSLVKNPGNFKVKIGTKISELIEECDGFHEFPAKIIAGGPMMGFAIHDVDTPVIKGMSGIIALSKKEIGSSQDTSCIQCGRCLRACPLGLSPTVLFKLIEHNRFEEAKENGLFDCKECGCCGYVCPARLPLIQGMKLGKIMSKKLAKKE